MADGDVPTGNNPTLSSTGLRFNLVPTKANNGTIINCRRVVTLIGSRQGCKVNLRHRGVSGVHVALVNDGSRVTAVDLVTKQGTLLNGLKMEHETLTHGDLIKVGPWELRLEFAEPDPHAKIDAHPAMLEPAPQVVAFEHVETGRILQPNRNVCVIGRRNGCDIVLGDKNVSRAHALLFFYSGHPTIFDLLSANQVRVNDTPSLFRILEDGDLISIGEASFRTKLFGAKIPIHPTSTTESSNGTLRTAEDPLEQPPDLIDIHATESSQRWRIADKAKKASKKS